MRPVSFLGFVFLGLLAALSGSGCSKGGAPAASIETKPAESGKSADATTGGATVKGSDTGAREPAPVQATLVKVKTNLGDLVIKLHADKSPVTVENFLENYVDRGFYNQTLIHYVDKRLAICGGYTAEYKYKEPRTPIRNEAGKSGLENRRGTVALSRDPDYPDSGASQFFINLSDNTKFNHRGDEPADFGYCVFGEIVDGLDVLDKIAAAPVKDQNEFPQTPSPAIVIESIARVR